MHQPFFVNILIIIIVIMDVALLALVKYRNLLVCEQGIKSVIYAVKLKL